VVIFNFEIPLALSQDGSSNREAFMPLPVVERGYIGPFAGIDVPWLVAMRARSRRDHPFLIWEPFDGAGETLTYGGFADRVGRLAAGLARRGLRDGDFLLVHLDNCLETILAWYAAAELGAVAVTTNTRSSGEELAYFAEHCGAAAAITQPAYAELVNARCRHLKWLAVTAHDAGAAPAPGRRPDRASSFAALLGDAADRPRRAPDPMAAVGVQYTSGTTARPKGVVWTHANALWGAKVNASHEDLRPEDVHLVYLPLFHTNAQAYSVLATLWAGASAVIQPKFSASRFWGVAAKHRCSWTSTIPFCIRALMEIERPKRHSFRLWGSGVSEPPTDAQFGVKTIGWWGMTETMTHGIVGEVTQPNPPLCIGRAASEYDIRILREDAAPVEPGETGELTIRGIPGVSLFKEYLNNPEATAASYDDAGYFKTGDRVGLLADGFIRFGDRSKDMLKVGGENVAASEIEQAIMTLPEVAEVAVVGRKHKMLDEVAVAFVLPRAGLAAAAPDLAERVIATCRAKLASFKVPAEVRLVDALPRSTLEKIAKAELRQWLAEGRR
jgi:crotonobetaine/carnitine-CoA ligase